MNAHDPWANYGFSIERFRMKRSLAPKVDYGSNVQIQRRPQAVRCNAELGTPSRSKAGYSQLLSQLLCVPEVKLRLLV